MTVRKVEIPASVRPMIGPAVYFLLVVWYFPVGAAYEEFTGMFERAKYRFAWTEPMTFETEPEDFALRRRAQRAVDAVLREIGHGVTVTSVDVIDLPDGTLAAYHTREVKIIFSSRVEWDENTMLRAAGHETTHALWAGLQLRHGGDRAFARLTQEMTAYVLGAHLAGRVLTREGRDGDHLRERLIADYRSACDDSDPESARNVAAASWVIMHGDLAGPDYYQHWGSVQMVDEIDAICARHPRNAVAAVRAIRDRYLPPPTPTPSPREWKPTPTPSASSRVEW
jgi:hypothetical protein